MRRAIVPTPASARQRRKFSTGYAGLHFYSRGLPFLWKLEGHPGLPDVLGRIVANHAAGLAELERLRASGMNAAAARREYVASLAKGP